MAREKLDGEFGRKIREERLRQHLTVAKLARKAKVSRRHLSAIEKGGNPTLLIVISICDALKLSTIDVGGLSLHTRRVPRGVDLEEAREAVAEAEAATARARAALLPRERC